MVQQSLTQLDEFGDEIEVTTATTQKEKTSYNFPRAFRIQVLALMLQRGWLSSYSNIISPEYFSDKDEREVAQSILYHREKYSGGLPTKADLLLDFQENQQLIEEIYLASTQDLNRTKQEVIEFAKDAAMRLAIMQAIDDLETGDLKTIRERISEALQVGADHADTGMEVLKDTAKWMTDLHNPNVVSTPWNPINDLMDGGLAPGELGLLMAPSQGMKSTGLVNIGFTAANHINKKNVIHFTLEMSNEKVSKRYAARITNKVFTNDMDHEDYKKELENNYHQKLRGIIKVKRFPTGQATVGDLRDFIFRLQDSGFDPGIIIVDYPDLLHSARHYKERRFELQDIYENLRGMAVELEKPCWGATQSNRASYNKRIISMEDIAEDIGKVNISDVILAICQTKEEEENSLARLYIAKMRDGAIAGKREVNLKVNWPALTVLQELEEEDNDDDDDGFNWRSQPQREES